jgi:glycosyltransferase involved in cell wall biosynthesis
MPNTAPKVSIGLAVYNGDTYLKEAVDSILTQTFTDFELIISDNASTDRTEEICRAYATQDERIRYHRNATNIGGANNENQTCEMARGKYFRWAAHDDVCAPTLLEKCVAVLDENPDVVLSYSTIIHIDAKGNHLRTLDKEIGTSPKPNERFRNLFGWNHDCETTYGLMRLDVLKATGLQRNYTDSDRTLLCHMALIGRFHMIPEPLFFKRIHEAMSTMVFWDFRERMAWFSESYREKITFPHWLQFFHYLEIITKTNLPLGERIRCYRHMIRWLIDERRWRKMIKDVIIAFRKQLKRSNGRSLVAVNES